VVVREKHCIVCDSIFNSKFGKGGYLVCCESKKCSLVYDKIYRHFSYRTAANSAKKK